MPAAPQQIPEIAESAPPRKRFTRDEFERLLQTEVFAAQRLELIDGDLIDKMGQHPAHALSIRLLLKWLSSVFDISLILVQLPIQAAAEDKERSLPEPDLAILRALTPDHNQRHPRGDEMLLVIEVSDTTAAFDQSRKAMLYARAGVPEYWVLDLNRRMLVAHREPDGVQYRHIQLYPSEEPISLPGRPESIQVANVLPPA